MSLKMFHVVFITLSIALLLGFGIWALREKTLTGDVQWLYYGVASLTAGACLSLYFVWFVRKLGRSGR